MRIAMPGVDGFKFAHLLLFAGEILDDAHSGNVLLQKSIQVRNFSTYRLEGRFNSFFKNIRCEHQKRHRDQNNQCKLPVGVKHHADDGGNLQNITNHDDQAFRENIGDGFQIRNSTGYYLPNRRTVKILKAEAANVVKYIYTKIFYDRLAQNIS